MGIALTFDDGPHPKWTPRVLDVLDRWRVRATFFVQADNVARWPQLVAETQSRGHQIGAHCFAHHSHLSMTAEQIERDIARLLEMLGGIGVRPSLWRPPYGDISWAGTHEAARRFDLHLVTWTVDTHDWTGRPATHSMNEVLTETPIRGRLAPNAVILMHDTAGPETVKLVPMLLEEIRRRGWPLGELTRHTITPDPLPMARQTVCRCAGAGDGAASVLPQRRRAWRAWPLNGNARQVPMTLRGVEQTVRRLVLRTRRSPLRFLWRMLYLAVARCAAIWLAHGTESTVYLAGSLAGGVPIYGLSDIDLVVVEDRTHLEQIDERIKRMHRKLPLLRRLVGHVWTYDPEDLAAAASAPYPTYGLSDGRAAFCGRQALRDSMGLLERPGLRCPAEAWRRLRGAGYPPAPTRSRQDERLAAWLELQYRWRWALTACTEQDFALASGLTTAVAAAARTWISLAHGEVVNGTRTALTLAARLLEREREPLLAAARLHDDLGRSSDGPMQEIWACFVRLCQMTAEQIEGELRSASSTTVALAGLPVPASRLPLLDWRALTAPPVTWPRTDLPTAAPETFSIEAQDPSDLASVAELVRSARPGHWKTLRSGSLLLRPTADVWEAGRLRGLELPASDPVSFALAKRRSGAVFPDVAGWSASDRAVRAVAEHRAWLLEHEERPAGWAGGRPSPRSPTPATLSLLLLAARAGLFLESLTEGAPRLALTDEVTVEMCAAIDSSAGEAAACALELLGDGHSSPRSPTHAQLAALVDGLRRLPAYAPNASPSSVTWEPIC